MSLLLIVAVLLISVTAVFADDAERIAKAKAEGQVVFYTTMGIDTVRPVTLAFEKKFPFLKVEVLRANSERMFNRVVVEQQTGKVHADVVNLSVMPLLKAKRVLAPYRSPEMKAFPEKFRDPDDTWTGLVGNYVVMGYNSRLVPEASAPRDWSDLMQPRWKGRMAMDVEDYDWFGAMLEYLGQENGKRLMQGLAKQELSWRKGHSLLAQLVAAGEFSLRASLRAPDAADQGQRRSHRLGQDIETHHRVAKCGGGFGKSPAAQRGPLMRRLLDVGSRAKAAL